MAEDAFPWRPRAGTMWPVTPERKRDLIASAILIASVVAFFAADGWFAYVLAVPLLVVAYRVALSKKQR
jgi:hypothetical protein